MNSENTMARRTPRTGAEESGILPLAGWTLEPGDASATPIAVGQVAASVPGCVHTDLLAAGLIDDPLLGDAEQRLSWIGETEWVYRTSFEAGPDDADRVDLVFGGLDTVATVTLNGVRLLQTENMHRSYRCGTVGALVEGTNTLDVRFASVQDYIALKRAELGDLPAPYDNGANLVRKMACNFGWDWGPALVTAGIWQAAQVHRWSVARLESVVPLIRMSEGDGEVEVRVSIERAGSEDVAIAVDIAGVGQRVIIPAGSSETVVRLLVVAPELWWPRGYGAQPLYPLSVRLESSGGEELDRWARSIGFRSVRLDNEPDADGTPYRLEINGRPIFVRGVNWIPDDPFPSRLTRKRLAERLAQAVAANVNYVRVWGGGRYESEDFYELADALGLMVGQDFLFACSAYPEGAPYAGEIEAEVREHVARLAAHPSLVTWTGNNECIWGFSDWGWQERLEGRPWGLGYYLDLLPRVVAEVDPTRPYWPGSPYSGSMDLHPNDPAHGTTHIWDVWGEGEDFLHYRDWRPRFVAEFGYQGPPAFATMSRALGGLPTDPESPALDGRQKADGGNAKLRQALELHLPAPRDIDDWLYLTQVNQARAVQVALEHFRSLNGFCTGTIVWQLNDCWPVISWACVDGDGRRKPLWYALRRAYADILVTVQPRGSELVVVVVNDSISAWRGSLRISRVGLDGTENAFAVVPVDVAPGTAQTIDVASDIGTPGDRYTEAIVVTGGPFRAWWFFVEDKDLRMPVAELDSSVRPVDGGYQVEVRARTFVRDLALFPDRLSADGEVDEALVTLLPGERFTFHVRTAERIEETLLTTRPVLRAVNDLVGEAT